MPGKDNRRHEGNYPGSWTNPPARKDLGIGPCSETTRKPFLSAQDLQGKAHAGVRFQGKSSFRV
jgi:hypothetical protein